MALLTQPRSPSGECADGDRRDVGVLPWPRPQPGALLRVLSTTFRAQAQKCRHALQIPPEKLHLQVPCPGAGGAKPQLCTFSCGGKKGGLGWGALSASGPALEDSLLPTYECCWPCPCMEAWLTGLLPPARPFRAPGLALLSSPFHTHLLPCRFWTGGRFSPTCGFFVCRGEMHII